MAFRILYNLASDLSTAVITSSSDGTVNTDDNAVDNRVGKKWRTDSDTLEWIKWDLVVSRAVDAVALLGHNLTSAATVEYENNATDSWGSPTTSEALAIATNADSVVIPRIIHFPVSATKRWHQFTFDDATNPDGYIQVGRIIFGEYFETTRDMSDDFRVEILDPSEGEEKPGEVPVKTEKPRFRRISTSFELIDQTAVDKWSAIFDRIGNNKPCLISWTPSTRATEDSAYVYLKTPLALAHQFIQNYSIMRLVWEEKTR
tara:strand:+ start:871 stop:1650 length:780 start_codon:yes stop_codon:yes gene_type:complete